MFKLTPLRAAASAILMVVAVGVALAPLPLWAAIAVPVTAVGLIGCLIVAPGQLAPVDRAIRRWRFRAPVRESNILYETNGFGTVFDGENVMMYVVFEPMPFQMTVVDKTETPFGIRPLPVEIIRAHLRQGDIRPRAITAIISGYRKLERSQYNDVYASVVGATPSPETLNVVLEVRVSVERSHRSILARARGGDVPAGAGQAAYVPAARLERALNVEGYRARLLTAGEVLEAHRRNIAPLASGLKLERWGLLAGNPPTVVARPAEWTPRAVETWFNIPSERMTHTLTMSPDRGRSTVFDAGMTFTYPDAQSLPQDPLKLKIAVGTQGDTATTALPLIKTTARRFRELALSEEEPFTLPVPSAGLGVFLGHIVNGPGRLLVNFTTGGEVLYVDAPESAMAHLVARISTTGATVGLHITGTTWETLGESVSPRIFDASEAGRDADVAVYRANPPVRLPGRAAVLVWAPGGVPTSARYTMSVGADMIGTFATPEGSVQFVWAPPSSEAAFIPSSVGNDALALARW
jgi:type VII secretion protein EccE